MLCFVGEKREVCFVGGPNKPLRKVVIDVGEGESWCEGLAYVNVSRGMLIDTFELDPIRPPKRSMDIGKTAGGKRTQRWLRLLELVAAVQHLERCATHSTVCRVCQHIKKAGGHVLTQCCNLCCNPKTQSCIRIKTCLCYYAINLISSY